MDKVTKEDVIEALESIIRCVRNCEHIDTAKFIAEREKKMIPQGVWMEAEATRWSNIEFRIRLKD